MEKMKNKGKRHIAMMSLYITTILVWITLSHIIIVAVAKHNMQQYKELNDDLRVGSISEESARERRGVKRIGKNDNIGFRRRNAGGVCPANKNAHVLYVTTNVGDNIFSFDSFGRYLGPVLNMSSFPKSVVTKKLRSIKFGPDGLLYASIAMSSYSRIIAVSPNGLSHLVMSPSTNYENDKYAADVKKTSEAEYGKEKNQAVEADIYDNGMPESDSAQVGPRSLINGATHMYLPSKKRMNRDCTRNYIYTLSKIDNERNPNLDHPYDFVFHPENGVLFVSNQNSITITRYVGPTTTLLQIVKIINETVAVITSDEKERIELLKAYMDNMLTSKREDSTNQEKDNSNETSTPKLFNFQVSPVEIGDPMPFSGGVSGLAGLPLPMPPNLFRSIKWVCDGDNISQINQEAALLNESTPILNIQVPQNRSQGAMIDLLFGRGKFSSSSSAYRNGINTTSTIGVFAASWSSFYRLLSVRGIAISPPVAYNANYKLFLYDLRGQNADMYDSTGIAAQKSFREGFVLIRMILVADVVSNSIHVFHEHTGELMWSYINIVPSPIQIDFPKSAVRSSKTGDYWFYVTSKNGGVYKVLFKRQTTGDLRSSVEVMIQPKNPMTAVSGFFEDPSHNSVYVADRKEKQILTYSTAVCSKTPKYLTFTGTFVKKIPDSPEYVLYTMVESQVNIPFCYELTSSGYLKYSVLCRAAQVWVIMGLSLLGWVFLYRTNVGYNIRSGYCLTGPSRNRRVRMESDSLSY